MSNSYEKSNTFRLRVWGNYACFTRPEMKVERVSYDVMTPSAARGMLEAILWKPAIHWHIQQIDVLRSICWESIRRNEVGAAMSSRSPGLYIEDHRQQRAGLFLKDVAYVIHAQFEITDKAGPDDNIRKFEDMFARRAEKGQCYHRPYFGCREFSANFELVPDTTELPPLIDETRDLGIMLFDIDFTGQEPVPMWFRARLQNGCLQIPSPNSREVLR